MYSLCEFLEFLEFVAIVVAGIVIVCCICLGAGALAGLFARFFGG